MHHKLKQFCSSLALVLLASISTSVYSQELTEEQIMEEIQLSRALMADDVRRVIGASMRLTREEGLGFWPVYDSYADEMKFLNDSLLALIQRYAEYYNDTSGSSDILPTTLVEDYLAIEKRRLEIREQYLDEFRAVLPDEKVMLFYQLQNRLHNLTTLGLQQQVPLVLE